MKSTGIIRRIDDLGRVIIPKEIRRTLRVREGDPMEIFLENGMVCFKKYDPNVEIATEINALLVDSEYCSKAVRKKLEEALMILEQEKEREE